ncbi:DsbA family protein [Magnetospirillum sp. SS-4]|uniref:DsbA family protein n=1 Tax=Magnetospirillum sp. SS-4 TaxID=2681465 RepID=UPI00137F7196|nr:DsbA family protein [Magnetospirillum sp. SS-4]CAA7626215.1 Protein-disulfide isomerase [Magnetospirillum sp. SS-4]
MIAKTLAALAVALGIAFSAVPAAAQDAALTPKQAEAVKKVVREYLMEHPEVLGEALEALREKMRAQAESDARKMMEARKDEIFKSPDDPVIGNPKGDLTIVEFFDYNCGFCKQAYDSVQEAVKADGKVKVVLKELPILGPDSIVAARVALVAKAQGQAKYEDVHRAFMKFRGRLDEKAIFRLAGEAGLNVEQLKKDINGADIDRQIKKISDLARSLEISGTPTFIIGDRIISSALDQATLKQLMDAARRSAANKG